MKTVFAVTVAALISVPALAAQPKYEYNVGPIQTDGTNQQQGWSFDRSLIHGLNPDGTVSPITTDGNGNLNINGTFTAGTLVATSTPASGTTSGTPGTFTQVFAANSGRKNCQIQNNGTGVMSVYEGTTGAASAAASWKIQPNGTYTCITSGVLYQGVVSITSTVASDPFSDSTY